MNCYMLKFSFTKKFEPKEFQKLTGICGIYFIFLKKTKLAYPFQSSRLIYIGMSEKKTNSIEKRLSDHFTGVSGNIGITNYLKVEELNFTYLNFEMLKNIWLYRIEDLESYFILDFVKHYGVYPVCNNKTGLEIQKKVMSLNFDIEWNYFD